MRISIVYDNELKECEGFNEYSFRTNSDCLNCDEFVDLILKIMQAMTFHEENIKASIIDLGNVYSAEAKKSE